MTTAEKISKLETEIKELRALVSLIVPLDKEGSYKTTFVKQIKKVGAETSIGTYTGNGSLLQGIK